MGGVGVFRVWGGDGGCGGPGTKDRGEKRRRGGRREMVGGKPSGADRARWLERW